MIDKLSEAIAALLPAALAKELRGNIDAVIRSNFEKMNLVTREQFEIREKVLHRTRARVTALEAQVADLERRLNLAAGAVEAAENTKKVEEKDTPPPTPSPK